MRVYYPGGLKNHTLFVSPANDPRAIKAGLDASWTSEQGEPLLIEVAFRNGRADVSDALGKYLVATGQAKRTALLLPKGVAA